MRNSETLEEEHVHQLPKLTPACRSELLTTAQRLFLEQKREKAEHFLLKTFHRFDLGEGTSYNLLIDFYRDMGFRSRENYWISEHTTRIYSRGKTNTGVPIVFSNPYASESNRLQFVMFKQIVQTCR